MNRSEFDKSIDKIIAAETTEKLEKLNDKLWSNCNKKPVITRVKRIGTCRVNIDNGVIKILFLKERLPISYPH